MTLALQDLAAAQRRAAARSAAVWIVVNAIVWSIFGFTTTLALQALAQ